MTDNRTTELLEGLRNVGNLHEFAELFGFNWNDDSDWTWHDVAVKMADDFEQAIAATLGSGTCEERGTLTADDIRDLIERHSDESGGNGRDFHNGAYVAIADELNTRAERTCHDANIGGLFVCSECGANMRDTYVGRSYTDDWGKRWYGTSNDHAFNYCPNCGCKVVDE